MEAEQLEIGDIVQIQPESDPIFGAALMIVTEPKSWGAQGYVHVLGNSDAVTTFKGLAYYRCKFENMKKVGKAEWIREVN